MTANLVIGRLVRMVALGSSAYLCIHLGVKRTPYMETALVPVLVVLTAMGLAIATLYQLTHVAYTLLRYDAGVSAGAGTGRMEKRSFSQI